jgi:hypothetical protein
VQVGGATAAAVLLVVVMSISVVHSACGECYARKLAGPPPPPPPPPSFLQLLRRSVPGGGLGGGVSRTWRLPVLQVGVLFVNPLNLLRATYPWSLGAVLDPKTKSKWGPQVNNKVNRNARAEAAADAESQCYIFTLLPLHMRGPKQHMRSPSAVRSPPATASAPIRPPAGPPPSSSSSSAAAATVRATSAAATFRLGELGSAKQCVCYKNDGKTRQKAQRKRLRICCARLLAANRT